MRSRARRLPSRAEAASHPTEVSGEPRSTFAGRLPESLKSGFAGATFTLDSGDPAADLVTVAFPSGGAKVRGFQVTGNLLIRTSGGSDRFDLEVDARGAPRPTTPRSWAR